MYEDTNGTNQIELIVQDKDNHHWRKTTSSEEDPHEHYHGNEPSTTIRLFKASTECNLDNLFRGENCSELKTGDYVKTQRVNIKGQVKEGDEVTTKFYEVINLEAASTPDNYTYTDILGSAESFGITADRFALRAGGNVYGRITNTTQGVLEQRLAALEGGSAALAVAS